MKFNIALIKKNEDTFEIHRTEFFDNNKRIKDVLQFKVNYGHAQALNIYNKIISKLPAVYYSIIPLGNMVYEVTATDQLLKKLEKYYV